MAGRRTRCSGLGVAQCVPVPPSDVRRPRARWVRDTPRRVQRKRTHRGTGRSLSTRKWAVVKEARIADSDEKNLSHDGLCRTRSFCISVSTTGRETTSKCSEKTQPVLCAHPSVLSHGHKNILIGCGDDLSSNDLLLNSSALLLWRLGTRCRRRRPVACLQRKNQQHTPHGTSRRETTRASVFTPTAVPPKSTAREVTQ